MKSVVKSDALDQRESKEIERERVRDRVNNTKMFVALEVSSS